MFTKIKNNDANYNFYNIIHSINKNNIYSLKNKKNVKKRILNNLSRAIKYGGLSKNGNKWQMNMMINKKNK